MRFLLLSTCRWVLVGLYLLLSSGLVRPGWAGGLVAGSSGPPSQLQPAPAAGLRVLGPGDDWLSGFGLPGTNGAIEVMLRVGNDVYIGGSFDVVGTVVAHNVARWNGTSWSALGSGVNGTVRTLLSDGQGNLYVGGNFTAAGGQPAA